MALLMIADVLLAEDLEEYERKIRLRQQHRILRDESDPFSLPNYRFLKLFRLTKDATRYLIDIIEPHLPLPLQIWAVPNTLKILVSLHFLGHGSYQLDVGGCYNFGMSQPTVSRCIFLICSTINDHLLQEWIKFPVNEESIERKKAKFRQLYNFPNTLAAIDCTHIAIIAPPVDHPLYPAAAYYNRKGYYSINTQIICDADLRILNINARFPGSVHDSAIWNSSVVKDHLRRLYLNDNLTFHLIGDSGYALQPWLMVPVQNAVEGSPEMLYNERLTAARNTIERANGVLKSRFRCLLKHRTLNYDPIRAAKIIYSCGFLHNFALSFNVELPNDDNLNIEDQQNINNARDIQPDDEPYINRGNNIRNNIIYTYFANQ